jgi:hypothetical protein
VSGEVTKGRREVTRVSVGCWGAGAIGELSLACFSKSHCRIFRAMVQMMLCKSSNFISNRAILFSRLIVVVGAALVDATG